MATLADLKTRIADELTRDDLGSGGEAEGALNRAIDTAIEFYADEQFWFNRLSGTVNTVGATATVAFPTGMRLPTQVSYLQCPLKKVDLESIQFLTDTGIPTRWAEDEGQIYLWPIPDGVYSLSVQGVADLGTPAADGDSNVWTDEGYDLIAARVKVILCRFPFRDADGLALALQEELEALRKVRRESRRRRQVPLTAEDLAVRRYNITTDR